VHVSVAFCSALNARSKGAPTMPHGVRKQCLCTFLVSRSLLAARGVAAPRLLADHPRKQRQTIQGSTGVPALPA